MVEQIDQEQLRLDHRTIDEQRKLTAITTRTIHCFPILPNRETNAEASRHEKSRKLQMLSSQVGFGMAIVNDYVRTKRTHANN